MEYESPLLRVVVKSGAVLVATKENRTLREAASINGVTVATLCALAREQDEQWTRHFNQMLPELLASAGKPLTSEHVALVLLDGTEEELSPTPSTAAEKMQALTGNFKGILDVAAALGLSKEQAGAAFKVALTSVAAEGGAAEAMGSAQQQCKQQ
jgi:hypothetical protein